MLYRASRDGCTAGAFYNVCDSSVCLDHITLVQVKARGSLSNGDRAVGGFSSAPWESIRAPASGDGNYIHCDSPRSFLFMLKDDINCSGAKRVLPERWGVMEGGDDYAVKCRFICWPNL